MAKNASVFARVDAGMKEQAEGILTQLGLPMSNAINLFLNQVVLRRGLPFEVILPVSLPLALGDMTREQIDAEIKKGIDACKNGQVKPVDQAFREIEAELSR